MKELTTDGAAQPRGGRREEFWKVHYEGIHAQPNPWLDLSNHQVQLQGFGAALDASGGVLGRTCLDAGCGRGQLSLALWAFGAAAVTGLDISRVGIDDLRAKYPTCRWIEGSISEAASWVDLGQFDLVFALEVLQYVAVGSCLPFLWGATAPGGRLIALVPNRECPIVGKTEQRFSGRYAGVSPNEMQSALSSLEQLEFWAWRGLWFRGDQRIAPYELSPWTADARWEQPPNRLLFVAQRAREVAP